MDPVLIRLLNAFGAVEIVGPMWCGKTWMARAQANSEISIADAGVQGVVRADLSLALEGDYPHLVDEWQEVPGIWDSARNAIDAAGGRRGMFILTGSSAPAKGAVSHSGTGRIARLRLRPMTLFELGLSNGEVSLQGLFKDEFRQARSVGDLNTIASAICKGGWPGALELDAASTKLIPEQYLDTLVSSVVGKERVSESRLRGMLVSLARTVGQAVSYNTLASDMVDGDIEGKRALLTRKSVERLLDVAHARFIIEDLHGWDAPVRAKSRVRTKPKRCFADPSLAAALLGINEKRLLKDAQLFGKLFEELCLRDLRVFASTMDSSLPDPIRYYQDADNLEVDVIIELRDGRWAAIEIKLGEDKVDEAVSNLMRLKAKVAANPLARNPEPAFTAVLLGKAEFCRQTPEGIYVFPITSLTA
jgi:predicted AAA+ superfamily ATPase